MAVVPENILHYRIIREFGKGGMGEVYLAQDTRLDRKVAMWSSTFSCFAD